MTDLTKELIEQVETAHEKGTPLYIQGGKSKLDILSRPLGGDIIDVSEHQGIVSYEASELVMTVRAGTRLSDMEKALAEKNQMLAFEPPYFGETATIGGTLACNLSGPARPFWGSVRDMTLGVRLINGKGEYLRFGGQVMKNVAGYDASRLQAGALGALGLMTEVSLKVLPKPEATQTIYFEMVQSEAIERMNELSAQPKPLSAACWTNGILYLRLSGAENAIKCAREIWGGEVMAEDVAEDFWKSVREHQHGFFDQGKPLWRFSVKSNAPKLDLDEKVFIDWAGAQRWVFSDKPISEMEEIAKKAQGHATLFKGGDRSGEVRQTLDPVHQKLQSRLKHSFDPKNIFNPGCLYSWM